MAASQRNSSGSGKGLDRERVARTALEMIDEEGTSRLSMRHLGQRLGVEAMSLYHHVSGREDLLEAVVRLLLDDLYASMSDDPSDTWQGYLQSLAHAVRRIAVEHPSAFPLVATRHPAAPWLRPPLRSLEVVEDFLATLERHGFTNEQMVDIYRAFTSFLLGNLLLEAAVRGADTGPVEDPLDEGDAQVPERDGHAEVEENPTVVRLRPLLSEDHSREEFEIGLETLLDRLELTYSQ